MVLVGLMGRGPLGMAALQNSSPPDRNASFKSILRVGGDPTVLQFLPFSFLFPSLPSPFRPLPCP